MTSVEMPSPGTPSSRKKTVPERLGTMSKRHNMQLSQSAISKKKASSERQCGSHKKRSLPEISNSKPRAEPSLHSVRSLPAGFRSTGGSLQEEEAIDFSEVGEGKEDSNGRDKVESSNLGAVIEEGGANLCFSFEDDVNCFRTNGDSPYGSKSATGNSPVEASSLSAKFLSQTESRWRNTSSYGVKKIQAWCQLPNGEWILGKILSTSGAKSIVSLSEGKVIKLKTESLLPANPEILDGVDDLMQLSYLNEPSVVFNLMYRYDRDMIYTKAGPVLIAINPFKEVQLYGNDIIEAYRCKSIANPHVYVIADTAIHEMIRDEVNQSIIISGESGAGKTETAKIAMQYLASLGGGSGIEYEILQTNPVLEAFGNAKTARNDNSSRFGKLIEIHFSPTGKISGTNIQTFLLEKSRVVQCAPGERSYHIFYQLCAGASKSLREKLNLKSVEEYKYLRQTNCFYVNGVNDAERFRSVVEAMKVVHISQENQDNAYKMLAAVLWFGNISFSVIDCEDHVEVVSDEAANTASRLLGCDIHDLKLALSSRKMSVGNDKIVQKLTLSQAIDSRDALAKSLYASLFEWVVDQINKSLDVGKRPTGRSISILDIYGFESFKRNGFEQFCINYANERLQQHFNRHLFKLEQEEYIHDGIDWAKVDFLDNQDCLNLFEKKPLGLLSLLDEESTFPNGTDLTFANKLKNHLHFDTCFKGERGKAFSVHHYAEEVTYDCTGFLEKNRDLLHSDSIQLLASCKCHLPKLFAAKTLTQLDAQGGNFYQSNGVVFQKLSVAKKFKGQLFELMRRLEGTTPHFIRCIKPNKSQLPASYEQLIVHQQLKYCGVLEIARIFRSGYPTRMSHQKFARRYGFLLLDDFTSQDPLSVSVAILQQFNILPEMYQVGFAKLFFRTGQIAALEDTRNRTLHGILRVQSCFRAHQVRLYVKESRKGIIMLQSFIRGEKTRRIYSGILQKHRAAIVVQKHTKGRITRKQHFSIREASIVMQSVIRGWLVRRCSGDVGLLKTIKLFDSKKDAESDQVYIKASVISELQRRILKAEAALRDKEEENDLLHQRLQHYENRWLDYEQKMKSMEDVWQKQMWSLQSSLSIAKRSLTFDDIYRKSDASLNQSWDKVIPAAGTKKWKMSMEDIYRRSMEDVQKSDASLNQSCDSCCNQNVNESGARAEQGDPGRDLSTGLDMINRLAGEFQQRTQDFADDAKFLMRAEPAQSEAKLNSEKELQKLKQAFESWKKDFSIQIREAKVTISKLASDDKCCEKSKKWWARLNSARIV